MANLVMPQPLQGKAARCRRDSIDCSFLFDIVFCSRSQQPVDEGNGATEHLEVAGIHGFRVSAPSPDQISLITRPLCRVLAMKAFMPICHHHLSLPFAFPTTSP
eukprot:scaffold167175_cov42-Cyclotella_meneghiniana.AAC.6